jgi:hypothetical protein
VPQVLGLVDRERHLKAAGGRRCRSADGGDGAVVVRGGVA